MGQTIEEIRSHERNMRGHSAFALFNLAVCSFAVYNEFWFIAVPAAGVFFMVCTSMVCVTLASLKD